MGAIFEMLSAKVVSNHRLCASGSTSESSKETLAGTAWLLHRYRVYGGTTNNRAP